VNLYRYLNERHSARMHRKLSEAVTRSDAGKAYTWEELEKRWEEEDARHDAQPRVIRRVHDGYWKVRRLARDNTPRRVMNRAVWFWQRGRRGWADCDAWSLDSYVTRVAAEGMARLAAGTSGWPGEQSKWATPEAWDEHLASLAVRLGAWNSDSFSDREMFEVTKRAMQEFADNLGVYWD